MEDYYLIACKIERGGFSNERTFEILLSDTIMFHGEDRGLLVGTAHADHLLDGKKRSLDEDTPGYGEPLDGFVFCKRIRDLDDDWALIEVPSADLIHVSSGSLVPIKE